MQCNLTDVFYSQEVQILGSPNLGLDDQPGWYATMAYDLHDYDQYATNSFLAVLKNGIK